MKIVLLILIVLIIACNVDNNQKVSGTEKASNDKSKKVDTITAGKPTKEMILSQSFLKQKLEYRTDTIKDYLATNNFLIGRPVIFSRNSVKSIGIGGCAGEVFEINNLGLITSRNNITDIYEEFYYDSSGRILLSLVKEHSSNEINYSYGYLYDKDAKPIAEYRINHKSNENESSVDTLFDSRHFETYFITFFKKIKHKLIFKKNTIIIFQKDMHFPCNINLNGKNKLIYYLNKSGLIDSLIINNMKTNEKVVFKYNYEY